ncbi:MAG TPA: MG2 domain-containing protein, partial [Rubrivivax sp.]|nr:MG2 domain-containing protein [Rubrivivax sp.]
MASGVEADRRAHTVFDRTLLRAGETVSMKHFVRKETEAGLSLLPPDALPDQVLLNHVGSDTEVKLPLVWGSPRSAESRWPIPQNAALGRYEVTLAKGDQRWSSGAFRVEAFRVPLVDARLAAPPGVQVAPKEIAFAAQINALAGGPMPGAALQLSAVMRPAAVQFAGYDEFGFEPPGRQRAAGGGSDENDNDSQASTLVADKLAATTDKAGAARIIAKGLPPLTAPSDLLAELSFKDPNGEVQTVSQQLRLWPSAVVVGLRLPGWTLSRGEAGLTAVVLSTDGQPVAGRAVEVRGLAHQNISTRKRIVGGFYAYDNQRQTRELGTLCKGTTDAQGRVSCSLKLESNGEVELIARARDDAGRVSEAASTLWVSAAGSGDEWWFAQDNDDRIDVLPERRDVQPGQTARLQVRMPFRQATALVTVEREGVVQSRVMTLTGRQPVIELPIPQVSKGAASWAPNVIVSVLVQRGRLREAPWWSAFTWGWREPGEWWRAFRYEGRDYRAPTGLVDMAKPSFKLGVAQLSVGSAEHKLDVQVLVDKPGDTAYAVRETVKTTVRVSHGGKPLAGGQVAFAAVDEGLLALQANTSWELLDGLLQPRPWGVATATALNEVVGRRHYGRKTLPPGGGGGRNPT